MVLEMWHVNPMFSVSRSESDDDVQSASAAVRLRELEARELAPETCYYDNPT